jgi:hypothetical protein
MVTFPSRNLIFTARDAASHILCRCLGRWLPDEAIRKAVQRLGRCRYHVISFQFCRASVS